MKKWLKITIVVFLVILTFNKCSSSAKSDFTTNGINVRLIDAKKGEDRFTICLEKPIPKEESNTIGRILGYAIFFTYKNSETYYLESVIGQDYDDDTTTCFENLSKFQNKLGSGLTEQEQTKIKDDLSNSNFKIVKIALIHTRYLERDTLAIKTFYFK